MTTLITGGAGFIGSYLAKALLLRGEQIVLLDNFDPYYDVALKRARVAALPNTVPVLEGDIRDHRLIEQVFAEYGVKRVAHMAAMPNVRYSVERGPLYADVNTNGAVVMMDTARKHGVETFVLASTSSVYGNTTRIPFVEDDAAEMPLAPYPASKRAAEIFAYSYYNMFQLNVTVLRFFNVYGPMGRPDMMPLKVIKAIITGETLQLYDGGSLRRDWTYVNDVVEGVITALERPLGYQVMNIGRGEPIGLTAFIEIYEQLIGMKAKTVTVPTPPSEPLITYCDNSRAKQLLDFNPKVSLRDGLEQTWLWYQEMYRIKS